MTRPLALCLLLAGCMTDALEVDRIAECCKPDAGPDGGCRWTAVRYDAPRWTAPLASDERVCRAGGMGAVREMSDLVEWDRRGTVARGLCYLGVLGPYVLQVQARPGQQRFRWTVATEGAAVQETMRTMPLRQAQSEAIAAATALIEASR
jgi:hypothetical protein